MTMFSDMENSDYFEKDWDRIKAMLSSKDADSILMNINISHLADLALVAAKSDPDTPTLMEALLGDHGEEFKAAIQSEGMLKDYNYAIVMPLADRDLDDIYRSERLSMTKVRDYTKEIADAMNNMHKKGIYHCDLKFNSFMFDEKMNVKL